MRSQRVNCPEVSCFWFSVASSLLLEDTHRALYRPSTHCSLYRESFRAASTILALPYFLRRISDHSDVRVISRAA